ncbi:MAG: diguanylate phosphodiesterase, partial [Aquificaceae bacterium]|nr:diguanylate phosphodiesterase [Aquificaceae bacterium]
MMKVVAKQPIFDRGGEIVSYELFLQDRVLGKYPTGIDPLKATSIVTNLILELGPEKVGNGKMVFINVPAIFLEALMFDILPQKFVGIELVEHRISDGDNLFESLKKLFKNG